MLKTNNKKQTFEIKCGLHSPLDAGDKEINHTNLIKPKNFITNRKVLSFQITNILLINKQKGCFINLVGKSGTGKSYFINALGYWISKRSIFKDGVIYIPFK